MEEQRFPLVVRDAHGAEQEGRVVLAPSWQAELAAGEPDAAFTIVLLAAHPAAPISPPVSPTIAFCLPARRPRAVREAPATYATGAGEEKGLRLSRVAMRAFAAGRILAAGGIDVEAWHVFSGEAGEPRLELLGRALAERRPPVSLLPSEAYS